ncbi:hypothetical protein ABZ930_38175 [Streptomyces sp. NPDC046716]|uniref:hypothetical protein n=1 Tax=Streptomyces sp. NPDC046716 TaxID=3157093 RepID=UPI0033E5BF21
MADAHFSAARVPAHPAARPGYGKRSAPDQHPRTNADFTHLPPREAHIAGFIDRLHDGADISVKLLASCLPYGQQAMRTALNNLQAAGHLRRGREHLVGSGSARWVTRSWFSRTARDDAWWTRFLRGDVPDDVPKPQPPTRNRAYILLAALGRTAPTLALSAKECTELGPLTETWFARGADEPAIVHALTTGLPNPVHSPAALVRSRLTAKLPPEPAPRPPLRVLECATCGDPGRPEGIEAGRCGMCRGTTRPPSRTAGPPTLTAETVHARAARIRSAMREEPSTVPPRSRVPYDPRPAGR